MTLQRICQLALCGLFLNFSVHASATPRDSRVGEVSNGVAVGIPANDVELNPEGRFMNKKARREETSWVLSLYTGADCDDDYYFVEGNNVQGPGECLNLIGNIDSEYTDNGVFCKYYTDGGFDSVACKNSIAVPIRSWRLNGGACLINTGNCTVPGESSEFVSSSGCQKYGGQDSFGFMAIESLKCTSN